MKRFLGLLVLSLVNLTAISMEVDFESQTAKQKQSHHWNLIKKSHYGESLPPITGPGFFGSLELMCPEFDAKAFTNNGDVMEFGRVKDIHKFGTVTLITVAFNETARKQFTGMFADVSNHGILRISLAEPPSKKHYKPGFALKLMRTNAPSTNIFAMPSLDDQEEANLFAHEYKTAIPKPSFSLKTSVLANRFEASLKLIGKENGNVRALSYLEMASTNAEGKTVSDPKAPYEMHFRPTKAAQQLFSGSTSKVDFRTKLEGTGKGIVLFEIYADTNRNEGNFVLIGTVTATKNFKASVYGDESLYFKHPMPHNL